MSFDILKSKQKAEIFSPGNSKPIFFQPKLTINQPNDFYEQEADVVSEHVMQMPFSKNKNAFFKPFNISSLESYININRLCEDCEEKEKLQRKKDSTGKVNAGNELESFVEGLNSGGDALPDNTRSFFEPRFGYDFSDVKVHTNSEANQSAQSINALAYTSGNNIVFNKNQFSPETDSGKKLLAHELTHVVQQNAFSNFSSVQRTIGDGHDLNSPRFTNDTVLEDIYDNNIQLTVGSNGPAVEKIQHALQDSGVFLSSFGIDGKFGAETSRAVTSYQRRKHISTDPAGTVGSDTMTTLNNDFPSVTDSAAVLGQNPANTNCITQILCPWNRALINDFHNRTFRVILVDRLFWADERFDGTAWVPNPMEGAGETSSGVIRLAVNNSCDKVAQSLYHEYQHARSPGRLRSGTWADEENYAYTIETAWSIERGLSPDPSLVTTDPTTGATVVNSAGVQSQVSTYPGMVTGSAEEVIAKVGATRVRVRRSNGSVYVRAAINGDTIPGPRRVDNPQPVSTGAWSCP